MQICPGEAARLRQWTRVSVHASLPWHSHAGWLQVRWTKNRRDSSGPAAVLAFLENGNHRRDVPRVGFLVRAIIRPIPRMVVRELLAKARALQPRAHIVLVDVSTTTSPATLNRALTHIQVGSVLRRRSLDSRSLARSLARSRVTSPGPPPAAVFPLWDEHCRRCCRGAARRDRQRVISASARNRG